MSLSSPPIQHVSAHALSLRLNGRDILHQVDLPHLERGEILAVVGPNGAGKSSLMKCLCGIVPYQGKLTFNGILAPVKAHARRHWAQQIGYVPQESRIQSKLTVTELLILAQKSHHHSLTVSRAELDRADHVLTWLNLTHLADKYCPTLSGGQMQMVAIAQALVLKPSLLLLDEPTSALDLKHQLETLHSLRTYVQSTDETGAPRALAIVILHDLNLALRYADKVLVINEGRSVKQGPLPDALSLETVEQHFGVKGEFLRNSHGDKVLSVF